MMKICESRIILYEEDFLENSLPRHGHVFNGWKEIKQGRFGASLGSYSSIGMTTASRAGFAGVANSNKRRLKANDKDKDKEKIYKGII